jgi:hypothetical protein
MLSCVRDRLESVYHPKTRSRPGSSAIYCAMELTETHMRCASYRPQYITQSSWPSAAGALPEAERAVTSAILRAADLNRDGRISFIGEPARQPHAFGCSSCVVQLRARHADKTRTSGLQVAHRCVYVSVGTFSPTPGGKVHIL